MKNTGVVSERLQRFATDRNTAVPTKTSRGKSRPCNEAFKIKSKVVILY